MKKISLSLILIIFLIFSDYILTQVTGNLILNPVMPSLINEWQKNPSLIQLTLRNPTDSTIYFRCSGTLYRNSERIAYINDNDMSMPLVELPENTYKTFQGNEVITFSSVYFLEDYKTRVAATGRIPEGNYKYCVNINLYNNNNKYGTISIACSNFLIIIPDPVNLILPLNGDTLKSGTFPEFTWTPVLMTGAQTGVVKYELRIIPVFEGQSLRDAVDKNPALNTKILQSTAYQYLPSDPSFILYPTANGFAWQVKAMNSDGSAATRNDGYSEIRVFYQSGFVKQAPPVKPSSQIETSIKNWNKFYGTMVKAINWTYEGQIMNENQRQMILNEITDPEKAWFPSGDLLKPAEITAARMADDKYIKQEEISSWRADINSMIKIGHHIARIKWTKAGETFSSICISDNDSLIYDSMLFNISLVEEHHSCFNFIPKWIWGSERGKITACVEAECKNGEPSDCIKSSQSSVNFGHGEINLVVTKIENCCKVEYSFAYKTGFAKIKTGMDGFTLEVEGSSLGSGTSGSGTLKDCCTGN